MSSSSQNMVNVHVITSIPILYSAIKAVLEGADNPGAKGADSPDVKVMHLSPDLTAQSMAALVMPNSIVVKVLSNGNLNDLARINSRFPEVPVLVLSVKSEGADDQAMLKAMDVKVLFGPEVSLEEFREKVFSLSQRQPASAGPARLNGSARGHSAAVGISAHGHPMRGELTSRQKEVLYLMSKGATNSEIAAALYMSVNTVKTHIKNILNKLGAANRTQAALIAPQILGGQARPGLDDQPLLDGQARDGKLSSGDRRAAEEAQRLKPGNQGLAHANIPPSGW